MPQPKKAAAPTSGPGLPAGHANMPKMLDEHPLDVDDLEDRYLKRMEELAQAEQKIFEDFGSWQRVAHPFYMPNAAADGSKAL